MDILIEITMVTYLSPKQLGTRQLYISFLAIGQREFKDKKLINNRRMLGHQNSLEWMPLFLTFMTLGVIKHPDISSVLGVVYIFSRYFYFKGYSTGDPKKRLSVGQLAFSIILINITLICK
ncbi:hypothetical protein DCAR_0206905 [Daucus carota subsp. sativus]|uniref:Uncharacterized protein n=1 Tax=Daucus carota subsp. sativus TaxID=79200 RepID=A0AAF1ALK6_DAUCS|nr:hypothetical protein DCAR_0206905 [Daucus carota subsp. sativus]